MEPTELQNLRDKLHDLEAAFEQYKHEQTNNDGADTGNIDKIAEAETHLENFRTAIDDLVD